MDKELHVALDTSAKKGEPEVVVMPKHLALHPGKHSLRWTQLDNEIFTFVSLTPLVSGSPFSNIKVVTPQLITAQYSNHNSGGEYEYTIEVADASGGHHSTIVQGGPIGNGGGPTIKNN